MTTLAIETEMQTYERELPNLLNDEGKYVLIYGNNVVDVYNAYQDALKAGYREAGLENHFMVKKIAAIEPLQVITRYFCPT